MLNSPQLSIQKGLLSPKASSETPQTSQYGRNLPAESINHITSFLDPENLLKLATVSSAFHSHIQDDHTWRTSFFRTFLNVDPIASIPETTSILLRRTEPTWREEYISRHRARRRWARSRTSTVTHSPLHSPVSEIHLMPGGALLSSSLQYGIVARSLPLTGKVLRGYLSPSPSGTGLGIGNPNTEFAPDVTTCAIFSEGGTAKIAWGSRNGEVAIMTAPKVVDAKNRSAAKLNRCRVEDYHRGEVVALAWNDTGTHVVSAGRDGRVKLWDAKKTICLWSSNASEPQMSCTHVTFDLSAGIIVACLEGGDIVLWTGFSNVGSEDALIDPRHARIGRLFPLTEEEAETSFFDLSSIHIDSASSGGKISLLVAYHHHSLIYRIAVDVLTAETSPPSILCDSLPNDVPISSVLPVFTNKPDESSFVVVGDALGALFVYPWSKEHSSGKVIQPIKKLGPNPLLDGAVSALAWNAVTVVAGSNQGGMSVFDAISFAPLRTFAPPRLRRGDLEPPSVKQILLSPENDGLVASIGDRVVGWKAGSPSKKAAVISPKARSRTSSGIPKGFAKVELKQRISESLSEIKEEKVHTRRRFERERQQLRTLDDLGLDEVEAMEYALMLSREEALERERAASVVFNEGVFEGDFEILRHQFDSQTSSDETSHSVTSSAVSSSPQRSTSLSISPSREGIPVRPDFSSSSKNKKVQISSPAREEPLEARFRSGPSGNRLSRTVDQEVDMNFPSISASPSPPRRHGSPNREPTIGFTSSKSRSKSAWSKPLPRKREHVPVPSTAGSAAPANTQSRRDIEEEELRLAIQLSLADAARP